MLAGNSLGGFIAANLAAQRPDLVEGLVFLNATPFWGANRAYLPLWKGSLPIPTTIQVRRGLVFSRLRSPVERGGGEGGRVGRLEFEWNHGWNGWNGGSLGNWRGAVVFSRTLGSSRRDVEKSVCEQTGKERVLEVFALASGQQQRVQDPKRMRTTAAILESWVLELVERIFGTYLQIERHSMVVWQGSSTGSA